jgi:hypothetical protein
MVYGNLHKRVLENRKRNIIRVLYILGLSWIILAAATTAQGNASTQADSRSLDEYIKIMDFQIPGWQQLDKPAVQPLVKNNQTAAISINTRFRSGVSTLLIQLIIPENENVYRLLAKAPKEDAKQIQVDGFGAIQIAPPPSPFEEYTSALYINVADRYIIILDGREVLDPGTMVNAAKAIDLKKLAALPR